MGNWVTKVTGLNGQVEMFLGKWKCFRASGNVFGQVEIFSDKWRFFRASENVFTQVDERR